MILIKRSSRQSATHLWSPAPVHQQTASNVGVPGVSESKVRGRGCFKVFWTAAFKRKKTTTVYYGRRGVTREAALERAKRIRAAGVAARLKKEGASA